MKRSSIDSYSVQQIVTQAATDYGSEVVGYDRKYTNPKRIATGIFALDFALGGGFPMTRTSIVYGQYSSWKTNLVAQAIRTMQRIRPHLTNVWIDVEGTLDLAWIARLGVDTKTLVYVLPENAEDAIDLADKFLHAVDTGIVAFDSLAALVKQKELDKSADQGSYGGASFVIGEFMRKTGHAMIDARLYKRETTCLIVNQIRSKLSGYGGLTMPGGWAQWFWASTIVRLWGKDIEKPAIHPTLPVLKNVSVVIEKWKQPIIQRECEFDVATLPHSGLRYGDSNDWPQMFGYLTDLDIVEKNGAKYTFNGQTFGSQKALRSYLQAHPKTERNLRRQIIRAAIDQTTEEYEGATIQPPKPAKGRKG